MEKQSYSLELSNAELIWLSRIFSKIALPLLFSASDSANLRKAEAEIEKGRDSLIAKKWMTRSGNGSFQVDRLLYFLVDWLSQPEEVIAVNNIHKEKPSSQFLFHQKDDHYLLVIPQGEAFKFELLADQKASKTAILQQGGFEDKKCASLPPVRLPMLQPLELVQLTWQSTDKAAEAMRVGGVDGGTTQECIPWLAELTSAGLITKYDYEKNGESPLTQVLYAENENGFWLSSFFDEKQNLFLMENITREIIITRILGEG